MRAEISYFSEDKFLLELTELSSKQFNLHKFDIERLAENATDPIAAENEQLLKRSYVAANKIMQKWGYKLVPGGHYEIID